MAACECDVRQGTHRVKLPEYKMDDIIGIPVILSDSVEAESCKNCGGRIGTKVAIPDPDGLISAVCVARVKFPLKLRGKEIKFLRKALNSSAKDLSEILQVSQETVSRWENDKEPIGVSNEKILRLLIGLELAEKAPAIPFEEKEIIEMKIQGVHLADSRIVMYLTYSQFREKRSKEEESLWEEKELIAA